MVFSALIDSWRNTWMDSNPVRLRKPKTSASDTDPEKAEDKTSTLRPSGPPWICTAAFQTNTMAISQTMATPSTLAETSTLNRLSTVATAQPTTAHTSHGGPPSTPKVSLKRCAGIVANST